METNPNKNTNFIQSLFVIIAKWVFNFVVKLVKGKAYSEMRKELKENAEKIRQNKEAKQKAIRDKYDSLRSNIPK